MTLQWPAGWPRTPASKRRGGHFSTVPNSYIEGSYRQRKDITVAEAVGRVFDEVRAFTKRGKWRIHPDSVVVSCNLKVRNDGLPYSVQSAPADPGVAVYFELDGKRQCVPCDTYDTVAQNIAGVAASLSALRALERHGSGLMERAFTGFEALPNLSADVPMHWSEVLGVASDEQWSEIEAQYMRLRSVSHPDKGGDAESFRQVQDAFEQARREVEA